MRNGGTVGLGRVAGLVAGLLALDAAAASEPLAIKSFDTLRGSCESVIVAAEDLTGGCGAKIGIMRYVDGRTGFYFLLAGDRILTFSGFDRGGDGKTFTLERIVYNDGTSPTTPKAYPASGACRLTGKKPGAVVVTCEGRTQKGARFAARFRGTGK